MYSIPGAKDLEDRLSAWMVDVGELPLGAARHVTETVSLFAQRGDDSIWGPAAAAVAGGYAGGGESGGVGTVVPADHADRWPVIVESELAILIARGAPVELRSGSLKRSVYVPGLEAAHAREALLLRQ